MNINHTWPVHGYEHCHGSFPLRWFPGSEAVWFDSQRGRDPEAAGEPCSRVNRADILAGNHWFLFFEFQVAAGRVFWDGS